MEKHEKIMKDLNLIHIKEATRDILDYIDKRRKGQIRSLKTRWTKFNKQYGGIEWNTFYTFAGVSGSGKSSIVNELETSLFDFNQGEDFVVLSLNYEMMSSRQVGRKLSSKVQKSVSELYSKVVNITDEEYSRIQQEAKAIENYKIYYSEIPDTVNGIKTLIEKFCEYHAGKGVIVMLDHSRLVRSVVGKDETQTLNDLATMFMILKKQFKLSLFLISQLNRNIEQAERLQNPVGHYPIRSDLFASDAIYQCSDYVFVLHRPEILNIPVYGPHKLPTAGMAYLHCIKARDDEPIIISLKANLKFNKLDEA